MSQLLEWKNPDAGTSNIYCAGITPITLGEDVYFATQLKMNAQYNLQSSSGNRYVTTTGTDGSMLLFCQPEFPTLFDSDDGVPIPFEMEFVAGDKAVSLDSVIFSCRRPLHSYSNCDAAYVEWDATEVSVSKVTKSISNRITI